MELFSSGMNILLIIIGFGLLIFVHELGHFLAAKWAKIRTEGFSIGFGPPIFSWRMGIGFRLGSTYEAVRQRTGRFPFDMSDEELAGAGLGETEYSLRWLPLGGFVKMLGQDDVDPAASSRHPRSFNMSPIGRRMVVISAGVVMNILLAGVLFIIAFSIGVRFESAVIGDVEPGSPAASAVSVNAEPAGKQVVGLEPGDRVLDIDGSTINTFGDIQIATAMGRPDVPLFFTIEREGFAENLKFEIIPRTEERSGLMGIGIMPASSTRLYVEEEFEIIGTALQQAGLSSQGVKPGMIMSSVNGESLSNYEAYEQISRASGGKVLTSTWVQPGDEGRAAGDSINVDLQPSPQWQRLLLPASTSEKARAVEEGLLGLVPLVRITGVMEDSPNQGRLEPGDTVLRIGQRQSPRMGQFRQAIADHGAGNIPMSVLRDGQRVDVEARIHETGVLNPRPMLGVMTAPAWQEPIIAQPINQVEEPTGTDGALETVTTPVAARGVHGGSRIKSIDGAPVGDWTDFWRGVHAAALAGNATIDVVMESPTQGREARSLEFPLDSTWRTQVADLGWDPSLPFYFFEPLYTLRHSDGNPVQAMVMGMQETGKFVVLTYLTIDRLFRGTVPVEQLHGPVGIVHLGTRVADRGFSYLLFFLGLISVNLAVINFLPLPIVDGGLFLYLVYEKFKGRPPSIGFQNGAAIVGLMFIATAFFVTFYNDIVRLIG